MRILLSLSLIFLYSLCTAEYKIETLADDLNYPWSITFLPDGSSLITTRSGELRQLRENEAISAPLANVPVTYVESQGGFFDVIADPLFSENRTIYLSLAEGSKRQNSTVIYRAVLEDRELTDVKRIFKVSPEKDTPVHYGGKLLFLSDNTLLMTTGDGFEYREAAQDRQSQLGKVLRMNTDGTVPADNPFASGSDGNPYVFSYGHRNPQGLILDPVTQTIYLHEHGPQGGDELNIIQASHNYGWPVTTFGINYSSALVSPLTSAEGITPPITYWVPSIAPSGMAIYRSALFPEWQGKLLIGALVDKDVKLLTLTDGSVSQIKSLFAELNERIRDVRVDSEGALYLLTDSAKGRVLRITPAT